jgi:hypothetical protein
MREESQGRRPLAAGAHSREEGEHYILLNHRGGLRRGVIQPLSCPAFDPTQATPIST